jgi:serine/threonine protein kinase
MTLSTGARLGPYEIVSPLGAGGMGEVYRARDARLGRDVAIKVLTERLVGDREHAARFEREARATARLNQVEIVLSEDFQDGRVLDGVRFMNPFVPSFDLAALVR